MLEESIVKLLNESPFYGHFLANMRRVQTDKIPTLSVNVTRQINLYINPEFFMFLTPRQRIDILKHECGHIIGQHCTRKRVQDMAKNHLWNLACDVTINESLPSLHNYTDDQIKQLKESGKMPEEMQEKHFGITFDRIAEKIPGLERNRSADYYYEKMKEKQDEFVKYITVDDHGAWKESEKDEEISSEIVKRAVKSAKNKSAGSAPGELELMIEDLFRNTVNWKKALKQFVMKRVAKTKYNTRKKRHRRYGVLFPGKKRKPKFNVAFIMDTSGSVSDEYIKQYFSEAKKIYSEGIEITMIEADAEVQDVYDFNPKATWKVSGRGGTMYSPALKKAEELDVDAIIYLGDGDCFENEVYKPKQPVLWCMLEDNKAPVDWGRTVQMYLGDSTGSKVA